MKQIHIVIVNYNAGDWLTRSVASALSNSDAEISVVDNNSTDNSIALSRDTLGKNSRLHWLINNRNLGFAAANNQVLKGLLEPHQEDAVRYAVLINPDCELAPQTLSIMLAEFERYPNMGLASCTIFNQDGSVQATCKRRFPTPWSAMLRLLQLHRLFPNNENFANFDYGEFDKDSVGTEFVDAVSGAFMMVRVSALHQVGLLDEDYFMHCEDLDWCMRFSKMGWKVGFIANASILHAKGVSSQSRPLRVLWTLHKGMKLFFDKHYRQQYSWLIRYLVKVGIYFSFVIRASGLVTRVVFSLLKTRFLRRHEP